MDGELEAIYRRWRERRGRANQYAPQDNATAILRAAIYQLTIDMLSGGHAPLIHARVQATGRNMRQIGRLSENPFHWTLLAMERPDFISTAERGKLARECLYAFKHSVPANLIAGFIWQIGATPTISFRLENGVRVLGFAGRQLPSGEELQAGKAIVFDCPQSS